MTGAARRGGAVLAVALAALAGCTSSAPRTSRAAQAALLPRVLTLPPGPYRAGPSGALDANSAAQATVVPPDRMSAFLAGHPLRAGYSRVWTYQDSYLTAVALAFRSAAASRALVVAAVTGLRTAVGTTVGSLTGVPGGSIYSLSGQQRVSGHYLFCAGAWFAVGADAYTVTECSKARPVDPAAVLPYARLQYQLATKPTH